MGFGFLVEFQPEPYGRTDAKEDRGNECGHLESCVHCDYHIGMMAS